MKNILECVDCIEMHVDDLNEGIKYYTECMGMNLLWKNNDTAGLGFKNDITKLVINTLRPGILVDIKVESVEKTLPKIIASGGKIIVDMFDIEIGKCAVIEDKFNNKYVILDMTKGKYIVDENKNIIGLE